MSKAALAQLTRTLAVELAPDGVRVNAISPGWIQTPMNAELRQDPMVVELALATTPAGRLGSPEDIAPAVLFLVSAAAEYVTVGDSPHWRIPVASVEPARRRPGCSRGDIGTAGLCLRSLGTQLNQQAGGLIRFVRAVAQVSSTRSVCGRWPRAPASTPGRVDPYIRMAPQEELVGRFR